MVEQVLFRSMLDNESGMAGLSVFLFGEGRAHILFEGEERDVVLSKDGVKEEFYILGARVWKGEDKSDLYSVFVDGKEYRIGLRNIGLSRERGFFLNGERHPLNGENTIITSSFSSLSSYDEKGIIAAFIFPFPHVPDEEQVAELSAHPSVAFWGYRVEDGNEEDLRRLNSILYSLDKARATIGLFDRVPDKKYLSIFDVSLLPNRTEEGRSVVFIRSGDGFLDN